jgi:hypothetical protein
MRKIIVCLALLPAACSQSPKESKEQPPRDRLKKSQTDLRDAMMDQKRDEIDATVKKMTEGMARKQAEEDERNRHAAEMKAHGDRLRAEQALQKRVERRDHAVKAGGDGAHELVRKYGEDAVDAILRCHQDSRRALVEESTQALLRNREPKEIESHAKKLVASRDKLERLPDPKGALQLIAREGGGVMAFMVENHERLREPSVFQAFQKESMEYVLDFKQLPSSVVAGAAPAPETAAPPVAAELGITWWPFALLIVPLAWLGRKLMLRPRAMTEPPVTRHWQPPAYPQSDPLAPGPPQE